MSTTLVEKKFETMGARIQIKDFAPVRRPQQNSNVQIDIKETKKANISRSRPKKGLN